MMAMRQVTLALCCAAAAASQAPLWERYDVETVNGHPGYMTAWNQTGLLDKVVVCVSGYLNPDEATDVEQYYLDRTPLSHMMEYAPQGWDIIMFNYQNPGLDIKLNAENLQHFLKYLQGRVEKDAYVAVWGWSMGNLVVRSAFAQEQSAMGVSTFVSLDGPHRGMQVSRYAREIRSSLISRHDFPAVRQMTVGEEECDELLGEYLPALETEEYLQAVIDPMNTLAVAFSDGSKPWTVNIAAELVHDIYRPVASFVSWQDIDVSEFITYHSATFMTDTTIEQIESTALTKTFRYKHHGEKPSRYFDAIKAFSRGPHNLGMQPDSVPSVMEFIARHAPAQ